MDPDSDQFLGSLPLQAAHPGQVPAEVFHNVALLVPYLNFGLRRAGAFAN
jgi:hypothetical protein